MHGYVAALIALTGNFLLSLGMVLQKKNVGWFGHKGEKERKYRRARRGWILGFVLMNLQPVFNYFALFGLPPNVVAAMIGANVAFTSVLAALMLGERLTRRRLAGAVVIFAAVGAISLTGERAQAGIVEVRAGFYYAFGAFPFALAAVLAAFRRRIRSRAFPTMVAAVAGALGGYMVITMKALQLEASGGPLTWLATPYFYVYFAAGAASFSVLQLAFHRGEVTTVSPADYGMQVLWSALAAQFVFGMPIDLVHQAAILAILASIVAIASSGRRGLHAHGEGGQGR